MMPIDPQHEAVPCTFEEARERGDVIRMCDIVLRNLDYAAIKPVRARRQKISTNSDSDIGAPVRIVFRGKENNKTI